jgi:hypothetical protein
MQATELAISSRTKGHIALTGGFGSQGEPVRCKRKRSGQMTELWLAASKLVAEDDLAAELLARYDPSSAASPKRRRRTRA